MRSRNLLIGICMTGVAAITACSSNTTAAEGSTPVVATSALPSSSSAAPTTTAPPSTSTTTAAATTTKPVPTTTTTTKPKPAPPPVTKVSGTPCTSTASACVDISKGEAWLITGGKIAYGPVDIETGKRGSRTPRGNFTVLWKDIDHKSKEFDNAPMPYSVFFYPGDAFHTGSLRAQSNGCVHLSNSVAKRFYKFLSVGDGVQVRS